MTDPLEDHKKRAQEIINEVWDAVEMPEEERSMQPAGSGDR